MLFLIKQTCNKKFTHYGNKLHFYGNSCSCISNACYYTLNGHHTDIPCCNYRTPEILYLKQDKLHASNPFISHISDLINYWGVFSKHFSDLLSSLPKHAFSIFSHYGYHINYR